MDNGAQAAEAVTRVVLGGTTFVLAISGKAALGVAKFLAAAASDKSSTSGKVRLKTLLQSGSELKVFTLQGDDNFKKFAAEAKDYGILYSVVKRTEEDVQGGVYDLMVRAEDAGKINRVIEKFHLIEVEGSAREVNPQTVEESKIVDARTLLSKMLERSEQNVNPPEASEESSLSDASLRTPNQEDRPSVVKELNGYIEEASSNRTAKKETPGVGQKNIERNEENHSDMQGIMPNLMGDELSDEEKRKKSEAAELLGEMLSREKEPAREV